jgi:protein phosphatase
MAMIEIACVVEAGVEAPKNDDRAAVNGKLISDGCYQETVENSCLAVVCDGVGGEAYGNEAAEIVANHFACLGDARLSVELIEKHIEIVNEAVRNTQKTDTEHSRMATTLAGLYIDDDDFIAFNVGDTRIYRYRSYVAQISKDHSAQQEAIDLGLQPKSGQESVITRYIGGMYAAPEIVNGKGRVLDSDVFLLCTDGIWGVLGEDDFEDLLGKEVLLSEKCQLFIEAALKNGSEDNLSIIIIRRT